MNRILRMMAVFAVVIVAIIVSARGTVWAGRASGQPSTAKESAGWPSAGRSQGTVITTDPVVRLTPGKEVTVASCMTVLVEYLKPTTVIYTATLIKPEELPHTLPDNTLPGALIGCPIRMDAKPIEKFDVRVESCFPIPPDAVGFAYYWDKEKWVKTDLIAGDKKSCVITPVDVVNPTFVALFNK